MNLKIGCAGWSYDSWKKVFYPPHLKKSDWLNYYSKYFNFVEVNSTFYNPLSSDTMRKWNDETPKAFRFSIKMWQKISHKYRGEDIGDNLAYFHNNIRPLAHKISIILIQFPPFFKKSEKTTSHVKTIASNLENDFTYAFEFRDESWFDTDFLESHFSRSNRIVATSYIDKVSPLFFNKQKVYYVRMMGDRKINPAGTTE